MHPASPQIRPLPNPAPRPTPYWPLHWQVELAQGYRTVAELLADLGLTPAECGVGEGALLALLGRLRKRVVVVVHANHAREFDADVRRALELLARVGGQYSTSPYCSGASTTRPTHSRNFPQPCSPPACCPTTCINWIRWRAQHTSS